MTTSYGSIQVGQRCRVISRESLLLTTESLGVSGTLLINLTMKTPSGFKSGNTGMVIGNRLIDSLHFHYNKAMYKIFRI